MILLLQLEEDSFDFGLGAGNDRDISMGSMRIVTHDVVGPVDLVERSTEINVDRRAKNLPLGTTRIKSRLSLNRARRSSEHH